MRVRRRRTYFLVFALTLLVFLSKSLAGVPRFMGLGDFPGGDVDSRAFDISGDGTTVVGFGQRGTTGYQNEAFRGTQESGIVGLGVLPDAVASNSAAISPDGTTIVGTSWADGDQGGVTEAFRWTADAGMSGLGDLPGGAFASYAEGVSDSGSVIVGGSASAGGFEAFRWTVADGMRGLGFLKLNHNMSLARDVSSNGAVIVGRSERVGFPGEAWRWTSSGGMTGLGNLEGGEFESDAIAVSDNSLVIVGWSNIAAGREAFRWTESGGMERLGDLAGGTFDSEAFGVSADGSVIVGFGNSAIRGREAFIWDALHGMRSLQDVLATEYSVNLAGWTLNTATAVSADGLSLAGFGTNPDGGTEAWIAHIPEPSTLWALALGLSGCLRRALQSHRRRLRGAKNETSLPSLVERGGSRVCICLGN